MPSAYYAHMNTNPFDLKNTLRLAALVAAAQAADLAVTSYGLLARNAIEGAPAASALYGVGGIAALAALKLVAVVAAVLLITVAGRLPLVRPVGTTVAVASGLLPAIWNVAVLVG